MKTKSHLLDALCRVEDDETYLDFRPKIRTGDILACSGSSWMSKIIQRCTKSPWSHVGMIYRDEKLQRILVFESVESVGVRAVPLSHYLENYNGSGMSYPGTICIARHDNFSRVGESGRVQLGQFAIDRLGYNYDHAEITRILARIMTGALKFAASEMAELEQDDNFICSEYLHMLMGAVQIDFEYDERGFITPGNIMDDDKVRLLAQI